MIMPTRRWFGRGSLAAVAVVAVIATACGGAAPAPAATPRPKLTVEPGTSGLPFLPLYVTQQRGFFAQAGVDVEIKPPVNDGHIAIDDATIGSAARKVDLAFTIPDLVLVARAPKSATIGGLAGRGEQVKFIGATNSQDIFRLYAQPEIQSLDDLAGKTLGMTHPGSGPDIQLRAMMAAKGPGADKAKYQDIGEVPGRISFLVNKTVSATLLIGPFDIQAERAGFHSLGDLKDVIPNYPQTVFSASEETIATKKDALRRFMSAIVKGLKYTLANPEQAIDIETQVTKQPRDLIASAYAFAKTTYSSDGALNVGGLELEEQFMVKYGGTDAAVLPKVRDMYDAEFLPKSG
ncbi:MAG TPA: ABC transporter substrate-binding protein [Candidatus Dormibacteraeota bacterium]|nr:ABC transporter substrate-binding protein [Candidatus Dormibacteraeota bacterium]